jgi:hypothetical protein
MIYWKIRAVAPVILTISDRFAATSSIKEDEGDYRERPACLLLFLDGRGVAEGDGDGDGLAIRFQRLAPRFASPAA